MFYINKALINIGRQKTKSLLMTVISALVVLFLFLFIGGLQANERQLLDLPNAMPVYGRITNLNGTMSTNLMIKESTIQGLEDSPYVTELAYASQFGVLVGKVAEEDVPNMKEGDVTYPLALAVNDIATYPGLNAEDINFDAGSSYDASFLEGAEPLCIIREEDLNRFGAGLSVGDTIPITITIFYQTYEQDRDLTFRWLGIYEAKVIGSYPETLDGIVQNMPPQIIFPIKWIRQIEKEADLMFFADSASFRINNTLELNAFKAQMKDLLLMSVIPKTQDSHFNVALTVNDEDFIKAATRVMDNISLMQTFMPFVCVTVGLVGFVVSYLLMHSRKPEIAVMRTLGMNRISCFALLFLEAGVLNLVGCTVGLILAALITEISPALLGMVIGLFFFFFMVGTAIALLLLSRFSVMAVLAALE